MDETGAEIRKQSSVGSDSNGEEPHKPDGETLPNQRICIVGDLASDPVICASAQTFGVPIVVSETGEEYANDNLFSTVFVLNEFEGDVYDMLYKSRHPMLGPIALQQLAQKKEKLPSKTRRYYNLSMSGVVVAFTRFRDKKDDLRRLMLWVRYMGGSVRCETSLSITHIIANIPSGEKYNYADTFRVPVMHMQWVKDCWENRNNINFKSTDEAFTEQYKLKPFHGARMCFVGFPEEEESHLVEVLVANGGCPTSIDDAACTHVVMDQVKPFTLEANNASQTPKLPLTPSSSISSYSLQSKSPLRSSTRTNTPYTKSSAHLETLHEKSNDELNSTFLDMQRLNLNVSSSFTRKRKITPDDSAAHTFKRKRNLSYSECNKSKMSDLFKTPLRYLSQRRRTIGVGSVPSFNDSVLSTSGVFDVNAVGKPNRRSFTPSILRNVCSADENCGKIRKNLFRRTFSLSKFNKHGNRRKTSLNSSILSIGESEYDDTEQLNSTCFPDFSLNPLYPTQLRSNRTEHQGQALTHTLVLDEPSMGEKLDVPPEAYVIKTEWFWLSVQKQLRVEEKNYLIDYPENVLLSPRKDSQSATPISGGKRKRKRVKDTVKTLMDSQSPNLHNKRRSSLAIDNISAGSYLDYTTSPDKSCLEAIDATVPDTPKKGLTARHQVFLELVQTETNYVNILHIIMNMFKKELENVPEDEMLLNNTEIKIIFGNVPLIYEIHLKMLDELRWMSLNWSEDKSIGNVILKYSSDLLKAYPSFINFFEEMKSMLIKCDATKPRFHAFLKACQTKPECCRQSLQDLLIRPVQRLPSISLLLNDILKNTPKSNADHAALEKALASIREVMTHINEDKRKTEGQRVMFDIFNEIDNCPPDLVSSHRNFIAKSEVIQLSSTEGLSSKGNPLMLFLFSDQLEVCKKRSKAFNSAKSPNTINGLRKNSIKPYKHVKLMSLNTIKRVIDIKETEECQRVFSLVFRNNDEVKERLCSFVMTDDEVDKQFFIETLCKQMAANACTANTEQFVAFLEPRDLEIDTSDVSNGTLAKAKKFATKTGLRVGRAFSFNKTPSKLKRAVSSMMSPFGSSTNLTPASQLAQMRLASYSNINELGNNGCNSESLPQAPMSVQPTRKLKSSTIEVGALKKL